MSEILDIEMGYVTTRPGARLHLAAGDRPHCGAGIRAIARVRGIRDDDTKLVCRRCRKALVAALARIVNIRSRSLSPTNRGLVETGRRLISALATRRERAAETAMLDDIRAHLAANCSPTTKITYPEPESDDQPTLF